MAKTQKVQPTLLFLILCQSSFSWVAAAINGIDNATISARNQELLAEVRSQVSSSGLDDVLGTDQSYQRYLKQSNFNVKTAVANIEQTANWRRSSDLDNLILDDVSLLGVALPYECTGKTADGNPVFYIPLGRWNFRKVQSYNQNARLPNYFKQLLEFNLRTAQKEKNPRTEEPVKDSVFIIDLQGFTIRELLRGWARPVRALYQALKTYRAHYPNTVKTWYVIRAPKTARHLWFVLRRFIPSDIAPSIKFYSAWSIRWRSELRNAIPKDARPKELSL